MTGSLAARRVSVIIPTCDRVPLLRMALASVRALEGPDIELEIIVADNGSTDGTLETVQEFGGRYMRVVGPGAGAARNVGMRAASGEFMAFLDDDDVWLAGHLRPQLELLRRRPELVGAVGQVVNTNSELSERGEPWPKKLPTDGNLFASFLAAYPQLGATVVRTTARDTVGYMDEGLLGDQDWDWHLRLALRHPVGFVAEPAVLFRQRAPSFAAAQLQWARLPYFRKVLLRNLRSAGSRRPSAAFVMRTYARHSGSFAGYFLKCAGQEMARGNVGQARQAVLWALGASAPHVTWLLLRDESVRSTVRAVLRPGSIG